MDLDRILRAISGLKLMKFFPADEDAAIELAKGLAEMAENEEQIEWLIRRVRKLYKEWPGEAELRAVFCSRFKPKDGINAYSAVYLDGVPPERPLPPATPIALSPGHVATADKELDDKVKMVADRLSLRAHQSRCPHRNIIQTMAGIVCQDCGEGMLQ